MPQGDVERSVQLGLLDRLIDNRPDSRVEPALSRRESLRRLRSAVKRDLEWLLNAVRTIESVPDSYTELRNSLYFYGLPDINSLTLESAHDEQRLVRSLESAIARFEPRLSKIRVTTYERLTKKKAALQFHVDALLMIQPAPERISFDTVLEVARGSYQVKDDSSA
jgi:type VI secretion system protein ImpF